ncbi:MAG: hypothetical protein P9L94_09080 [Candidatus Hinthialibacter antarcticus]|nr:hypothetical protein [Candidatus Hinthialibacter antarcticus]
MKHRVVFAALLIVCIGGALVWQTPTAHAQAKGWCEEIYLARETAIGRRVSTPAITADGDNVFVVYRQGEIRFLSSTDRGKTWNGPISVTPGNAANGAPAIAKIGNKLVVSWPAVVEVGSGMSAFQLFYSQSVDNGKTWSAAERIHESRDDAMMPRMLPVDGQLFLLWLETPLSETLGKLSLQERLNITPESIETLRNANARGGQLQQQMRQVQSIMYVSSFSPTGGTFSPANRVEQANSQTLPHVFNIFGPYRGSLFVTVNENTDLKLYESKDGGQTWRPNFQGAPFLSTRMQSDIKIVDGKAVTVWTRRDPFERIPVNFEADASDSNSRSAQLSVPHYVRSVPRIAQSDNDYHVVWEAGESEDSWLTYIRTDDDRPTSSINHPSSGDIETRTMTFQWNGDDNISASRNLKYSYTYGEEPWTRPQPQNQATLQTPPDGEYTFKVRAEDVAGNIQEPPAEFAFNTIKSAPVTQLTNAPVNGSEVETRQFTLEFIGSDNNDSMDQLEYSAKLDDGDWTPYQKGTSHTFSNLANGSRTFAVRMRDARGNVEQEPPSCNVIVKIGMELVLETKPDVITSDEALDFGWKAIDDKGQPVKISYRYQLDEDEVKTLEEPKLQINDLEEGVHVLQVWGIDASGDQTPKVEYKWMIDRTPPDLAARFAKSYQNGFPVLTMNASDPALPDGADPGVPTMFQYKMGGDWIDFNHQGSIWLAPKKLAFYSLGYSIEIRAIDDAGNVDVAPAVVGLQIWARTNPLIFYPIVVLVAVALIVLLLRFIPRGSSRKSSLATSPALDSDESDSSFADDDSSSDFDYGSDDSSFSFDDDDDKKKDEDPYA